MAPTISFYQVKTASSGSYDSYITWGSGDTCYASNDDSTTYGNVIKVQIGSGYSNYTLTGLTVKFNIYNYTGSSMDLSNCGLVLYSSDSNLTSFDPDDLAGSNHVKYAGSSTSGTLAAGSNAQITFSFSGLSLCQQYIYFKLFTGDYCTFYSATNANSNYITGTFTSNSTSTTTYYYRCYDKTNSTWIDTSATSFTSSSITRPTKSGYTYAGYVYHNSWSSAISQSSYDGTGTTCTSHSSTYPYVVFFYTKDSTSTTTYTWGWTNLGSGTSSTSFSISLSAGKIGYYYFTPSASGTLTVTMSSTIDNYGWLTDGNCSLGSGTSTSAVAGANALTGGTVYVKDDDSGEDNNFYYTYSVTSGTKYEIDVHAYSILNSLSGTLTITFTAATYTITLDANEGSVPLTSYKVNQGSIATLLTPTRDNYTFNGWYTAATGGTRIGGAGDTFTPTGDITLYAQWSLNYTSWQSPIQFGQLSSSVTTFSQSSTLYKYCAGFLKWTTPSYSGKLVVRTTNCDGDEQDFYSYLGTDVEEAAEGTSRNSSITRNYILTENDDCEGVYYNTGIEWVCEPSTTYYWYINDSFENTETTYTVDWELNYYKELTLTYDVGEGEFDINEVKFYYDDLNVTISSILPTREGYTFLGWADDPDSTIPNYKANTEYTFTSDITLYAIWKEYFEWNDTFTAEKANEIQDLILKYIHPITIPEISFDLPKLIAGESYISSSWIEDLTYILLNQWSGEGEYLSKSNLENYLEIPYNEFYYC